MVLHCLVDQLGKNTYARIISFEQVNPNTTYIYIFKRVHIYIINNYMKIKIKKIKNKK